MLVVLVDVILPRWGEDVEDAGGGPSQQRLNAPHLAEQ